MARFSVTYFMDYIGHTLSAKATIGMHRMIDIQQVKMNRDTNH